MKNSLTIGVIVILIILGIVLWGSKDEDGGELDVVDNATTTDAQNLDVKTTTVTPSKTVSGMKTSLGGIFDVRGNYQCDYELVTAQSRSTNVIYISDGRMRGEFRTSAGQNSSATMLVYDGSYLYVWTEGKSTGVRTQPKTIKDLPALIPEDITSGKILGSGINSVSWICHAWTKDEAKLVKPSYVTFY